MATDWLARAKKARRTSRSPASNEEAKREQPTDAEVAALEAEGDRTIAEKANEAALTTVPGRIATFPLPDFLGGGMLGEHLQPPGWGAVMGTASAARRALGMEPDPNEGKTYGERMRAAVTESRRRTLRSRLAERKLGRPSEGRLERVAEGTLAGTAALGLELPVFMAFGAAAGSTRPLLKLKGLAAAGSRGARLVATAAQSAAAFMGTGATRESLRQGAEGEWDPGRLVKEVWREGLTGAAVGLAGMIPGARLFKDQLDDAGQVVGRTLSPRLGVTKAGAEIGAFGAVPKLAEGELPTMDDMAHAIGMVGLFRVLRVVEATPELTQRGIDAGARKLIEVDARRLERGLAPEERNVLDAVEQVMLRSLSADAVGEGGKPTRRPTAEAAAMALAIRREAAQAMASGKLNIDAASPSRLEGVRAEIRRELYDRPEAGPDAVGVTERVTLRPGAPDAEVIAHDSTLTTRPELARRAQMARERAEARAPEPSPVFGQESLRMPGRGLRPVGARQRPLGGVGPGVVRRPGAAPAEPLPPPGEQIPLRRTGATRGDVEQALAPGDTVTPPGGQGVLLRGRRFWLDPNRPQREPVNVRVRPQESQREIEVDPNAPPLEQAVGPLARPRQPAPRGEQVPLEGQPRKLGTRRAAAAAAAPAPTVLRKRVQREVARPEGEEFQAAPLEGPALSRVEGMADELLLPDGSRSALRFVAVEASDLQPSHRFDSFAPNPGYPKGAKNERDYQADQGEREKVAVLAQQFKPGEVFNITASASAGTPIAFETGQVIGGNGRTMMVQRVYGGLSAMTPEALRAWIIKSAPTFELDPAAVAKLKQPVIVRMLPGRPTAAEFNVWVGKTRGEAFKEVAKSEAVFTDSLKITERSMDAIDRRLADVDPDATLRQAFAGDRGIVAALEADLVITPSNKGNLTSDGALNTDGLAYLERLLFARVVQDRSAYNALAGTEFGARVAGLAPHILRIDAADPSLELSRRITKVAISERARRAEGGSALSVRGFLRQVPGFRELAAPTQVDGRLARLHRVLADPTLAIRVDPATRKIEFFERMDDPPGGKAARPIPLKELRDLFGRMGESAQSRNAGPSLFGDEKLPAEQFFDHFFGRPEEIPSSFVSESLLRYEGPEGLERQQADGLAVDMGPLLEQLKLFPTTASPRPVLEPPAVSQRLAPPPESLPRKLPAGSGVYTLAGGIRRDLLETGVFRPEGKIARSPHEAAVLMQPTRSPLTENFWVTALDGDGRVLHFRHVTSRAVDYVALMGMTRRQARELSGKTVAERHNAQSELMRRFTRETEAWLSRIGAKSFVIHHNHPSGNASASSADMRVARHWQELGDRIGVPLRFSLVIDHGGYSYTEGAHAQVRHGALDPMFLGKTTRALDEPLVPSSFWNHPITGPDTAVRIVGALMDPRMSVGLVYRSAGGKVRGVQMAPTGLFHEKPAAEGFHDANFIGAQARKVFGASEVIAVYDGANPVVETRLRSLVESGHLRDFIHNGVVSHMRFKPRPEIRGYSLVREELHEAEREYRSRFEGSGLEAMGEHALALFENGEPYGKVREDLHAAGFPKSWDDFLRSAERLSKAETAARAARANMTGPQLSGAARAVDDLLGKPRPYKPETAPAAPPFTAPTRRTDTPQTRRVRSPGVPAGVQVEVPGKAPEFEYSTGTLPAQVDGFLQHMIETGPRAFEVARRGRVSWKRGEHLKMASAWRAPLSTWIRDFKQGRILPFEGEVQVQQLATTLSAAIADATTLAGEAALRGKRAEKAQHEATVEALSHSLGKVLVFRQAAASEWGRTGYAIRRGGETVASRLVLRNLKIIMDAQHLSPEARDALITRLVATNGDPARVMSVVREAYLPTWWDKFHEFRVMQLLSGPVTIARNVLGNTAAWAAREAEVAAGVGVDAFYGIASKALRKEARGPHREAMELVADLAALPAGFAEGVRMFTSAIYQDVRGRSDRPHTVRSLFEGYKAAENFAMTRGRAGELQSRLPAIQGNKGVLIRTPGRIQTAVDLFFSTVIRTQEAYRMAARSVVNEKIVGPGRWVEVQKRAQGALGQDLTKIETVLSGKAAAPTLELEIGARAEASSRQFTFREELGKVAQLAERARLSGGVGGHGFRLMMPFFPTPVNIARFTARRIPLLGLVGRNGKELMSGNRELVVDAMTRQLVGAAFLAPIVSWAVSGLISGPGPKDKAARDQMRRSGWQPFSARIGDRWWSYTGFSPVSEVLAIAGSVADSYRTEGIVPSEQRAMQAAFAAFQTWADQPFLTGVGDVASAIWDRDTPAEYRINGVVQNFVSGTVIPRGVAWLARALDPTAREYPEDTLSKLMQDFPATRGDARPLRDALGRTWESPDSWLDAVVSFEPTRTTDPVDTMLWNLKDAPDRALINYPDRKFLGRRIPGELYQRFLTERGEILLPALERLASKREIRDPANEPMRQTVHKKVQAIEEAATKRVRERLLPALELEALDIPDTPENRMRVLWLLGQPPLRRYYERPTTTNDERRYVLTHGRAPESAR